MTLRKWILLSVLFSMLVGCNREWSSGDRVLVSKINYDTGITPPSRYDVVVFKFPLGPVEKNSPKNYIKRLLGLPGELLAIFFGRIYRWSPQEGDLPPFDDLKDAAIDPNRLFEREYMHIDSEQTRFWFEEGRDKETGKERRFEILRKPPHVMMALRRIVFDNDYQAKDLKGKLDRWSPDKNSGWKSNKDTGFVHDGSAADQVDWLRYQHLVRPEDRIAGGDKIKPRLITDSMDYNSFQTANPLNPANLSDRTPPSPHWVGDLMIECNVEIAEAKGEFWLELSKGINRFQARWDLTNGKCTLSRIGKDDKVEEFATQTTGVIGPGSHMLRFANFDARLTVWVDRQLPFGDGMDYDPPEVRGPKEKSLSKEAIEERRGPRENDIKRPASIGSKGARVTVTHVRLWRDTYYTTSTRDSDFGHHGMPDRDAWADPGRWDALRKQRFTTMYVQPGHYLCLGDNSQASSDSREWGVVPQRLMLGRALLVYFPLDRMGRIH